MTPERIAEIYTEETGFEIGSEPAALQDFARWIWNEAIFSASVRGRIAQLESRLVDNAILELKLPEEP